MIYESTDNRVSLDKYFFEMDTQNNIHIYKNKTLEYVECIELNKNVSYYEFEYLCRKWLKEKGLKTLATIEDRENIKNDINNVFQKHLVGATAEFKATLFRELIQDLNL